MADVPLYPASTHWWVKAARFINILDPDVNGLSPTRIQAWASTTTSILAIWHDIGAPVAQTVDGYVATAASLVWAGLSHWSYHVGKRERNKRIGGEG